MVILSFVICIISFFSAVRWVNKPFPGFLFYKNLVITDTVSYKKYMGLQRISDRIIGVNGEKVNSPRDVYRAVNSVPIGTVIDYRIARNGDYIELSIPTMRFTIGDFLALFGVVYSVGLIFLIVGTFVYHSKPYLHSSRIFFLFCFSVGIWFITSFHSQSTYLFDIFDKLPFLGCVYCPVFAAYLAFAFPSSRFVRKTHYVVFSLMLIFASALFILNLVYFDSYNIWKNIHSLIWLNVGLGSLALPISATIAYFKGVSILEKQRAQMILLGSFFGLFLPTLGAIGIAVVKVDMPFNLLALPVIIFPIGIAYAIVKHRLFDIERIVKRTLVYSALTGVVVGIIVLVIAAFNAVFASYDGWKNRVFFVILTTFLVFILSSLKNRIQGFLDLTFFRKKYDYRITIKEISSAMTSFLNLDEITDKIINTVEQTMFSNTTCVILFDWNSGGYLVYAASKNARNARGITIKKDSELINLLNRYNKEIFKEDLIADERYITHRDELIKVFNDFNAYLLIPVFFKKQLVGILSLGEKKSGLSYTSEDIELLYTLADQSAIAIQNALAYKLVEDYAKKIEETNKELQEIQAQLIQAEKMSAIGQLAAGVAHEIRNPLNIIEGARYYLSQIIDEGNSEVVREYLGYIKHEVERTSHLIDKLVKFSRAEPRHFASLDMNNLLESTLILVRKQLYDNGIRLVTNFNPRIPNVVGDSSQLCQVFINIIVNAIQAMPRGGEIQIDTGYGSQDKILLSFTDTGDGIEKENLTKIFNPFFTTKDTGAGLGLSISYKIVEEHKGRITVSSEKGRGSTFVVELPASYDNE